jgi:hypothetical protein
MADYAHSGDLLIVIVCFLESRRLALKGAERKLSPRREDKGAIELRALIRASGKVRGHDPIVHGVDAHFDFAPLHVLPPHRMDTNWRAEDDHRNCWMIETTTNPGLT